MLKKLLTLLLVFLFNAQAADTKHTQEQLDQMLAPIALYPDALLSQILMASTFNDQLEKAIEHSKANPDVKGDKAVEEVQDKGWDASVASLVAFPEVLLMLGEKPEWTKNLGNAFLAEPSSMMDRVQFLRKQAKDEGNLETTKEQKVEVSDANATQVITIVPATSTVYVPVYNPTYVYGPWMYPAYPPFYYYPPYYTPVPGFIFGFTFGVVISNSLWGGFGWHNHSVNINVHKYNNINVNKISSKKNNVNWKDHKQRPNNSKLGNARGSKDMQRANARKAMDKQGLNLSKERSKLSGSNGKNIRENLNKGKFNSPSSAFSGISKPSRSHVEANRGNFSRNRSSSTFKSNHSFSHSGGFSNRSSAGGGFRGRR